MRIYEVMTTTVHKVSPASTADVITVAPNETIRKAANLMRGHLTGCLPVVDGGRLVGVVTIADMLRIVGKGVDRPGRESRAATHYRVPHRKSGPQAGRW